MLLLALHACAPGEPPPSGGSAEPAPASCDPLGVAPWQAWTEEVLPTREDRSGSIPGAGAGDLDGDGDTDLLVAYQGGSFALRNDGTGTLAMDEAITLDGAPFPGATAVHLADLDADGDLDGWLGRSRGLEDLLFWNDGAGRFTSTPLAGSTATPGSGVIADFDGDGALDIFVAGFVDDLDMFLIADGTQRGAPSQLYRNVGGRFERAEGAVPAAVDGAICYQAAALDAEGDGDLDLYMANDTGPDLPPNRLLLNDGAGRFSIAEDCFCDVLMASMGVVAADADGEGSPDLYISDFGPPTLLLNDGTGGFFDATIPTGAYIPAEDAHSTGWGVVSSDLDRDGCNDLVMAYGQSCTNCENFHDSAEQYGQILLSDCAGGFTREEPYTPGFDESGRTRSILVADLDGDGRPDLVTVGKHFVRTWKVSGGCDDGLTLRLADAAPNRAGLGAKVVVTRAGGTSTQWMLPATAHSSNAPELYFGLGGEGRARSVTVTWPDGRVTEAGALPSGLHTVSP